MYEEVQTLDMRNSSGSFALTMADGSGSRTDTTGLGLDRIFANRGSFTFSAATCTSGSSYTPSDGDGRNLVVLFKDETMASWEPIPAQKINYVPYAFSSQMVQGFGVDSLLRVVDAGGDPLTGLAPLSNAQYTALLDLVNGSSAAYTKTGQLNGVALPTMTSGEVLGWNGTAWVSQAATSGPNSITTTMIQNGAVDGAKLDPAISISTSGTIASAITTTRDFKIYNATNQYVEMVANNAITGTTDVDGHVFYKLTWPAGAASTNGQVLTSDTSGNLTWTTPSSAGITTLTGDVTATGPGSAAATVASVGTSTAANIHSAEILANAASPANTADTIVKRDGTGGFAAGAVSATSVSSSGAVSGASVAATGAVTAATVTATGSVTQGSSVFNDSTLPTPNTVTVQAPASVTSSYVLKWPTSAGGSDEVLKTDASGNLSWSALPTALPPTGSAGGDLTGTYPNPTIAGSAVTTSKINDKAVTYAKIQDVTTGKLLGRSTAGPGSAEELSIGSGLSLSGGTLSSTNISSQWTTHGSDISYDGAGNVGIGTTSPSALLDVAGAIRIAGSGSETCDATHYVGGIRYNGGNIQYCDSTSWKTLGVAGAGLTALTGDVTASGTGSVAATVASVGGSTAAQVHQSQLDTAAATSVNTPSTIVKRDASGNFAAGAISTTSVTSTGAINGASVTATGAVTGASVKTSSLQLDNGVSLIELVNPSLSAAYTLTLPSGTGTTGQILTTNGLGVTSWSSLPTALPPTGSAGGDLTGTYPNPTIAANAVVTSKINDAAVTTPKINDAAVTTLKLGDKSVTYAKIQDVTTGKLLGRSTAGPGSAEELSIGSGLSLSGGTLSSTNVSSQWTTHGSNISYDGAGNVGIGTTAPAATLDVRNTSGNLFHFGGGANQVDVLASQNAITVSRTGSNAATVFSVDSNDTATGRGVMRVTGAGGTRELIWADASGNVGIGTTAPSALLDVAGAIRIAGSGSETCDATHYVGGIRYNGGNIQYCDSTSWKTLGVAGAGLTALTGDVTASGTGSVAATVASVGGVTAANVALGANAANAATDANTPSTIVKRDTSGGFAAGAISGASATFTGSVTQGSSVYKDTGSNTVTVQAPPTVTSSYILKWPVSAGGSGEVLSTDASGNMSWSALPTALPPTGTAGGDLTGTYPNPSVATVGTSTAANIHSAELLANAATDANTSNAIVKRDGTGNFTANVATLNGVALNNAGSVVNLINPPGAAYTLTLPTGPGTGGQVLSTNGSGVLSWASAGGGGDFKADGSVAMTGAFKAVNGTASAPAMTFGSDIDTGIYRSAADEVSVATNGVQRFRIGNSNTVVYGSSLNVQMNAPTSQVFLNANNPAINGAGTLQVGNGSFSGQLMANNTGATLNGVPNGAVGLMSSSAPLTFTTAVNERLRITSAGNVGIGTTNPGYKLDVSGIANATQLCIAGDCKSSWPSGGGGLPADDGAAGTPSISFTNDTNTGFFRPTTDTVALSTNGTERMRVNASGNVGIGTTNPSQKLDVNGAINASGNIHAGGNLTSSGIGVGLPNPRGSIEILSSHVLSTKSAAIFHGYNSYWSNPNSRFEFSGFSGGSNDYAAQISHNPSTGVLTLQTSTNSGTDGSAITWNAGLNMLANGNVGIGTAAPAYKLDVNGVINATGVKINGVDVTTGGGDFKKDGSVAMTGTLKAATGTAAAPSFTFASDADTGLYSNGAGRVGFASNGAKSFEVIGTSNAYISNGILRAASGSVASPSLSFENNDKSGLYSPAGFTLGLVANNIEAMRIDSSGRIGIGTSAPNRLLHVSGEVANGLVEFERSNATTNTVSTGLVLKHTTSSAMTDGFGAGMMFTIRDNSSVDNEIAHIAASRSGADNSGLLYFQTYSAGNPDTQMRIFPDGRVSLATSSPNNPASRLDVRDTNKATTDGAGIAGIFSTDPQGADLGGSLTLGGQDGSSSNRAFAQISGRKSNNTSGNSDGYLVLATRPNSGSLTERMRIDATGNVGIGTTAPTARLTLAAGSASAGTAPLKFTSGPLMTTPEDGAMEYNSASGLWFTVGSTRYLIPVNTAPGNFSNVTNISNASGSIVMSPIAGSGSVQINSGTPSSNSTSGALIVTGGAGISQNLNVGGNVTSGGSITSVSAYMPQIYGGTAPSANIKIDGTDNATKGNVLLATAGGNVGIGTTSPDQLLTLSKSQNSNTAIKIMNPNAGNGATSELTLVSDSKYGSMYLVSSGGTAGWANRTHIDTDGAGLSLWAGAAAGDIRLSTGGYNVSNERMRISSSGNVGIGTTIPDGVLTVSRNPNQAQPATNNVSAVTMLRLNPVDNVMNFLEMDAYSDTNWKAPILHMRRTKGTAAAPTNPTTLNVLGSIRSSGWSDTNYASGTEIYFQASENWTATAHGASVNFNVTPKGSTGAFVAASIGDYWNNAAIVTLGSSSNWSTSSWTTEGKTLNVASGQITDNTGSGTIAQRVTTSFMAPVFASANPVTLTNAANIYVAGAPTAGANTTITSSHALFVNAGNSYFGGNVGIGTTAPETTLDVAGTGAFGSTLENTSAYVNSGSAYTVPDTSLNIRRLTLTADTTITLPAFTSTGVRVYNLTLFLKQDATGGRAVTFAGNGSDTIKWDSGFAPPISSTANKITIIQLMKTSDEGVWYGSMTWRED